MASRPTRAPKTVDADGSDCHHQWKTYGKDGSWSWTPYSEAVSDKVDTDELLYVAVDSDPSVCGGESGEVGGAPTELVPGGEIAQDFQQRQWETGPAIPSDWLSPSAGESSDPLVSSATPNGMQAMMASFQTSLVPGRPDYGIVPVGAGGQADTTSKNKRKNAHGRGDDRRRLWASKKKNR